MEKQQYGIPFAPGKSEVVESVIVNVSTAFFRDKIKIGTDAGHITVINMQTEDVGHTLEKYNGRLLCITRRGIAAMFEHDCNDALQFAITLCQDAALRERRELFKGIGIGIGYGSLCLGTVGYKDLCMPLMMSETMDTVTALSENAQKYNSRILVTGDAMARLSGSKQFNSRRLGMIYHKSADISEEIYDVYDGDLADTKYSKMRSRLFFETGVKLFLKGAYLEARTYFIEILKADRNDAAAKQYVFKCDNCMADETDDNEKKYLEIW